MNNIWIINQYASTLETGWAGRTYYLGRELAKQGHKVYLVAPSFSHVLKEPPKVSEEFTIETIEDNFSFLWIRMPEYSGAHDRRRVLNWLKFAWKLLKLPKVIKDSPDDIIYSSPSLIPYLSAERLARKTGSRLIWDIRDLWPLTLIELRNFSRTHPFIRVMQWVENKACRTADFVVSNLPYAIEYLREKGVDSSRFLWLPNGFDMEEFENPELLSSNLKNQLPKDKFVIGYAGTLGRANALNTIVDAAILLKHQLGIHFVIVGGGTLSHWLENQIKENQLENITLIGPIHKKLIPSMLSYFDVCYAGFRKISLYRFGTSLNKLSEYFMSNKPILYSIDSPFKPVNDANAGFTVPAEDPHAIVDAILKLKSMSISERNKMGENGRKYALENHDYEKLAKKLSDLL